MTKPIETDAVIFDLDGTLWDTCPTCAIGWNSVLQRHEIVFREITAADVRAVAGRPHEECIRHVFTGVSEADIRLLIKETTEEDNRLVAQLGGALYPGVVDGLKRLNERYPLFIVSNCQAGYIEAFLAWSGLAPYFQDIECWGNTGRTKAENLRSVIERNRLRRPLFVGDTQGDASAARACNVPFAFVDYGFGTVDHCDVRASSFDQLSRVIIGLASSNNGGRNVVEGA